MATPGLEKGSSANRRFSLQVETSSRSLFSLQQHHHQANPSIEKENRDKIRNIVKVHSDQLVEQLQTHATLNVDPHVGLSSSEAQARLNRNGKNELPKDPPKSQWEMLVDQFSSVLVIMLLVSCVISMATGQFAAGLTIIIIVAFNALLGVIQESKAGAALDALDSLSAPTAEVIRDGTTISIASSELVVGDIVLLDLGKKISADLLLIDAQQLSVNEMALTGESEPVPKSAYSEVDGHPQLVRVPSSEKEPAASAPKATNNNKEGGKEEKEEALTDPHCVYMGCTVVEGRGKGVVIKTGLKTKMGEVAHLLKEAEAGESPLQVKLGDLGVNLGIASMAVSALVFFLGIFTGRGADPNSDQPVWLQMLMIAVSLTVAAVPEGLPTCVTITLAIGMHNMVKKNALIRNLHSVETLGSASVICTDKTGTLTAGAMTATRLYFKREIYKFTGVGYSTKGKLLPLLASDSEASHHEGPHTLPLLAAALCSNATIQNEGQPDEQVIGNSSDKPIVVAAAKVGLNAEKLAEMFSRLGENPFNSTKKCMSVVVEATNRESFSLFPSSPNSDGQICPIVIVKGAPDVLLSKCINIVDASTDSSNSSAEVRPMNDEDRAYLSGVIDEFSSQALRVMAVCTRTLPVGDTNFSSDAIEHSLTFLGLMASIDPERPEVADAIAKANEAGIRVVMITGDYVATAVAIAKRVGILDPKASKDGAGKAIDCAELRSLADVLNEVETKIKQGETPALLSKKASLEQEIDKLTARVDVYSRAKPVDKITIVRSLQRQGHVVSMTGDGVNDAPALKQANIGVAMGITGTDVAKAASDMVLTDDNFVSIVAAIEQGRTIYANIVKFCFFLLSTNVSEVLLILFAVLMGMQCPLLPIQILWLNLATDGAPAIALALEAEEPGLMSDGPRKLSEPLMDTVMYTGIVIQTIALTGVTLACFMMGNQEYVGNYYGIKPEDMTEEYYDHATAAARTMTIILIVFAELLRAYTCRTLRVSIFDVGIFTNVYMQYSVGISVGLTLFFATNPFFMEIFSMTTLTRRDWILILALSMIPVTVDEMTKWVYRQTGFGSRPKFVSAFGYSHNKEETKKNQ